MTPRSSLRFVLWACSWALVLVTSRTALAAAPFCDERGASAIAPPPVLEARDVRIDVALPLGCELPVFARASLGTRHANGSNPVIGDGSLDEAWIRPTPARLPKLAPKPAWAKITSLFPTSSGYGRGVFRPPRA
jgi:hypothetical protein